MLKYELYMGTYYLKDEYNHIVSACDEVGIAFDKLDFILLKYGDADKVEEWCTHIRQLYIKTGLLDIAEQLTVIRGKFLVEDLNRILDTSGWLKSFLEKYNIKI